MFRLIILATMSFFLVACNGESPEPPPVEFPEYVLVPKKKTYIVTAYIVDNTWKTFIVDDITTWNIPRPWKPGDTLEIVTEWEIKEK